MKCLQLGDMPAESNVLAFVSLQGSRTIELGEIDRQHFEVRGEKENVRVLPLPRPRQSGVGGGGGVEVQTEFLPVRRADPKLVPCERVLQGWEATKGVAPAGRTALFRAPWLIPAQRQEQIIVLEQDMERGVGVDTDTMHEDM